MINVSGKLQDMPKLECPFEKDPETHKILPVIKDEFRWVFTTDCIATDKLDGTNVSILIEDGKIKRVFNRTSEIILFSKGSKRFYEGVYSAVDRKYINAMSPDGQHYGELIGPQVQGNPYYLEEHMWIPFSYLIKKYSFKFWNRTTEMGEFNGSDEEIFNLTSDIFKELWSLFKRNKFRKLLSLEDSPVTEKTGFSGLAAEGIVFYRKSNPEEMCKIRRDMFCWFVGNKHKSDKKNINLTISNNAERMSSNYILKDAEIKEE